MAKNIRTIPVRKNKFSHAPLTKQTLRKTAAYARVSTDREEQETSYEQGEFITEFDSGLWSYAVDYMTVYSKNDIRVTFKDGTEI